MNTNQLEETAQAMVTPGRGILAADQGASFIGGWLESLGHATSDNTLVQYRTMIFGTPQLSDHISGIILMGDVLAQQSDDGTPLLELITQQGIMPGLSPGTGQEVLAGTQGEVVPIGLEGLRERLAKFRDLGFRFTKWRAPLKVGPGLPTSYAADANAYTLGQFAALSQEAGLVPIVEPEVEMLGDHTVDRHFDVSEWFLRKVFQTLYEQGVYLEGMILKTNMIVSGKDCPEQVSVDEVADMTLKCLRRTVPAAVPGIAFLSGGQSDYHATAHLNAMNAAGTQPWTLSFSYGRALQRPAMTAWAGKVDQIDAGRNAMYQCAKLNGMAAQGSCSDEDLAWFAA
ncbi:MAG: class I fructose-bisphosphate aldolase [Chloroflexota bacterium]